MQTADSARISKAILYLAENFRNPPDLEAAARAAGMSRFHFQRLFTRWAGISPKRFLQFLAAENARKILNDSENLLDAAYEAGLSGPGRLHDLIVNVYAVTPGELRGKGAGLTIRYGAHEGPFGPFFLAVTDKGVCALSFLEGRTVEKEMAELRKTWTRATVVEDARERRRWRTGSSASRGKDAADSFERRRQGDQFPGQGVGGSRPRSAGLRGFVRGARLPGRERRAPCARWEARARGTPWRTSSPATG